MLEIEQLNFSYGRSGIIQDLNLSVKPGEFVGIIGPNGAGKSTLLKLLNRILEPASGKISIDQKMISTMKRSEIASLIAYVPQESDFIFSFSVQDIVRMGRFPYQTDLGLYSVEDMHFINSAMEDLEITQFSNRKIFELSGGEKQRVIIASALAQDPQILILDEPTTAMDLHHQIEIYNILKRLQREKNLTNIIVTHDINLAAQYCSRMIIMNDGKIVSNGTPEEVLQFQVLQQIFGVKVYIDINPVTNSLYILPYS